MLESAQLAFVFEPDRDGVFGDRPRADQRSIERDLMKQIKDVVADATLRAWLAPPPEILSVEVGGTRINLDPGDESMTRSNLTSFFSSLLAGAATQSPDVHLALDVTGQIKPICKVKVDGQHVDAVRCPVAVVTLDKATGQSRTTPWILQSSTSAGTAVTTQVQLELQYVAPDPH